MGEGKRVRVVAHSTGGLVARWLVEKAGGDKLVSQLVMLGTPNDGWPWPSPAAWATASLGLAMNGFARWPAKILGGLMSALRGDDAVSDQAQVWAAFAKELEGGAAPPVPYSVVVGRTPLPAAALRKDGDAGDSPLERLFARLSVAEILPGMSVVGFYEQATDLAVSAESMRRLPPSHRPASVSEAACDHLSYFGEGPGARCLRAVLARDVD